MPWPWSRKNSIGILMEILLELLRMDIDWVSIYLFTRNVKRSFEEHVKVGFEIRTKKNEIRHTYNL